MTTNHRPTLESKKGKVQGITNTIQHSRSLPQQTKLKYRHENEDSKIDLSIGKRAFEELKRELDDDAIRKDNKFDPQSSVSVEEYAISSGQSTTENSELSSHITAIDPYNDELSFNTDEANQKENNEEGDSFEEDSGDDVTSDSEDESEDDTAALLEELEKIKQERKQQREEDEAADNVQSALRSNPLVNSSKAKDFKVKKGWRNDTAFGRKKSSAKQNDEKFTNDTLKSDFHQKFLTKYIR